jgi:uncharacterized protein YqgV (UPF0045/DUF77 family)
VLEEAVMIQATIAIYPLGQADHAAVHAAIERLRTAGVVTEVRSMYTEIAGDEEAVFAALQGAYRAAAAHGGVVMIVSVSNACPAQEHR